MSRAVFVSPRIKYLFVKSKAFIVKVGNIQMYSILLAGVTIWDIYSLYAYLILLSISLYNLNTKRDILRM